MTGWATLPGRLRVRYWRALERWLPPGVARSRDARNRALMFLVSHTVGPVLGNSVALALWAFDPTPGWEVAVLAAAISLFWAFPALLRRGVAYERLVLWSVVNLNFCILWGCYRYGGVASPTLPWVLVIPILALFYVGGERRLQPRLLGVTGASFAVFVGAAVFFPAPNDIPPAAMHGLGTVSTVATLAYVATVAIYYARIFDAGVDLEEEIGRRRVMADELRRAVVAADRSGAAKAEFLARMSHEIRTPLNAIVGYGEVLLEEALDEGDEALRGDVARILDAGRYLARLVDMILDLSKLEAGRMTFDPRPQRLRALLEAAVAARRAEFEAAGIRASVEVEPGLDAVEADGRRLAQVIDAVVENAIRHAPGGTVALRARGGTAADGRPAFFVSISDTGGGIPPAVLPTLFTMFSAAREASGGRYGGTGLNLTLCSRLCQAMGGGLGVDSRPGEGSTFTIALPRAGAPGTTHGAHGAHGAASTAPVRAQPPEAEAA